MTLNQGRRMAVHWKNQYLPSSAGSSVGVKPQRMQRNQIGTAGERAGGTETKEHLISSAWLWDAWTLINCYTALFNPVLANAVVESDPSCLEMSAGQQLACSCRRTAWLSLRCCLHPLCKTKQREKTPPSLAISVWLLSLCWLMFCWPRNVSIHLWDRIWCNFNGADGVYGVMANTTITQANHIMFQCLIQIHNFLFMHDQC